MTLYHTRIRLKAGDYLGKKTYFVTICCRDRRCVFGDEATGAGVWKQLEACSVRHAFTVHAYCVMPDHLHFVVGGAADSCDLLKFVHNFKQRTGFKYKQTVGQELWQGRFYEHILRRGDRVEDVACYVWWNPVRAGLCTKPREYRLSGSQTVDWVKWNEEEAAWCPPWKSEKNAVEVM